jgi:type VI secretion system secreted protein Hcp
MAIDEQRWQPESPFTEFEGEEYISPPLESGFGEEEVPVRLARFGPGGAPGTAQGVGRVFVKITAQRQGVIAGDSTARGHEGWLVATGFDYELKVPRDVATGQASGRRQHSPAALMLPWTPASPQIFSAAVSNEVLSSVILEFPGTRSDGVEVIVQRITLTDAGVASFRHLADPTVNSAAVDRISLTFRQITIEDLLGGKSAHDDWRGSQTEVGAAESWESEGYEIDASGVQRSEADVG